MPQTRDRAVVIGGGFAGLLAARALAEHFATVTVIERDLRTDATRRRGVPQFHHPHGLLHRGAEALEILFPGLRAELRARGAATFDFGERTRILFPSGWAPAGPVGVDHLACSRPLLDDVLHRRVGVLPPVRQVTATVHSLLWRDERVAGVRDTTGAAHPAELVVDASGRTSRLTDWLTRSGTPVPARAHVFAGLTYVTRAYEDTLDQDWHMSTEMTYAPTIRHGCLIQRVEADRVLLTLIGADGVRPPYDTDGFEEYAATLRSSHPLDVIKTCAPLGRTYRYGGLHNHWNPYHHMRDWPDGLIALGDAVAALNPIYGHGLTVAALEALALRDLLAQNPGRGLTRRFQRTAADIIRVPWLLASRSDAAWRPHTQRPSVRLTNWALRRRLSRVPDHPGLYRKVVTVQNLLAHPATLASPWP
ncbi:NAD(P)/FAD-dependent oxidoreductase [Streptomyces sp. NRRL B-1347]|uniref:NAD(P)/FAD-dependent oxidoreductase n=1 Tax=Streptomyces sp. NRRL B-1347 TaxID=1476877 RepID=UPI00068C78B5|nr:FAD-dependent oxidoreductase [Streptomyces sp. NRRL B-1347]